MSYKLDLSDLERGGAASLLTQLVERFSAAIDGGSLGPGEKLPTTRALAEAVGINHLTAVRAYRRLAELGYVTAAVGRGTFVRTVPPARHESGSGWQSAVLPEQRRLSANDVLAQTFHTPADPEMISLATGWPSPELYPAADLARIAAEVFAELGGNALSYLEPEGLPGLREELARRGRATGFATDAEEIVVTTGARQAIDLVCRTVLEPGDVAVTESPTFAGALGSLQASGARIIGVPVDEHGLDIDALERVLARHEVKLVAVQPSSHNPTGRDLAPERARRLLELARARSFFVLEDGVYATVRFDGRERERLRHREPDHVIYVDSLSKTVGGGLRLGWVAASGPVLRRIAALKFGTDVHTSGLVQHLAQRYLASGAHESLLAATTPVHRARCDALRAALERRLGDEVEVSEPLGGHHVWVRMNRAVDERVLFHEAIRHGVTFMPGSATMAEPPPTTCMRLSFALLDEPRLEEGVRRLAMALRAAHRSAPGARRLAVS